MALPEKTLQIGDPDAVAPFGKLKPGEQPEIGSLVRVEELTMTFPQTELRKLGAILYDALDRPEAAAKSAGILMKSTHPSRVMIGHFLSGVSKGVVLGDHHFDEACCIVSSGRPDLITDYQMQRVKYFFTQQVAGVTVSEPLDPSKSVELTALQIRSIGEELGECALLARRAGIFLDIYRRPTVISLSSLNDVSPQLVPAALVILQAYAASAIYGGAQYSGAVQRIDGGVK